MSQSLTSLICSTVNYDYRSLNIFGVRSVDEHTDWITLLHKVAASRLALEDKGAVAKLGGEP